MTKLNKEKVYESYDEIVHWFDDARPNMRSRRVFLFMDFF
jgi:hypothetical protein